MESFSFTIGTFLTVFTSSEELNRLVEINDGSSAVSFTSGMVSIPVDDKIVSETSEKSNVE